MSVDRQIRHGETTNRLRRAWLAWPILLLALYVPFGVITAPAMTSLGVPAIEVVLMWLTLPGFCAGIFAKPTFDDAGLILASGITTLVLVFALFRLSRWSWFGLVVATVLAISVSVPTAIFARRLFLA